MSDTEGRVRDKKYLPMLMPKMTGSGLRRVRPWQMDRVINNYPRLEYATMILQRNDRTIYQNGVAQLVEHRLAAIIACRRTDGGSSPPIVPNQNFFDMENKTIDMNLSIVDAFKKNFPNLDIKTPTWAVLGVTAEFRKLQVGDIVLFPIDSYNYQTIRSTPGTSMVPEVLNEGRQWKTKLDKDNKSVAVLRIA